MEKEWSPRSIENLAPSLTRREAKRLSDLMREKKITYQIVMTVVYIVIIAFIVVPVFVASSIARAHSLDLVFVLNNMFPYNTSTNYPGWYLNIYMRCLESLFSVIFFGLIVFVSKSYQKDCLIVRKLVHSIPISSQAQESSIIDPETACTTRVDGRGSDPIIEEPVPAQNLLEMPASARKDSAFRRI